jgi:plasmid maintenance system antidote protein VapI
MTSNNHSIFGYEQYSLEELAEAFVFPVNLTDEERALADAEIRAYRLHHLAQMPKAVKVRGQLLGLKFRMEDYVKQKVYNQAFTFGACVQMYLDYLEKTPTELATEIQIAPAKLATILKNQAHPNPSWAYRLEKHSGKLIPALLWWQLVAKKMEYEIQNDTKNRKRAGKKVNFELASN